MRNLTVGEQFVELGRDLSRLGLPLLDEITGLTGKKRKLIEKRDEMIRSSSNPEIEDIARNVVESFHQFAASLRESEGKSMMDILKEKRSALSGEVLRDEA